MIVKDKKVCKGDRCGLWKVPCEYMRSVELSWCVSVTSRHWLASADASIPNCTARDDGVASGGWPCGPAESNASMSVEKYCVLVSTYISPQTSRMLPASSAVLMAGSEGPT